MSAVLQFPARNKGRVRRSHSVQAMGRCSLSLLEREGGRLPPNVADIREARDELSVDDGGVALRLALAVFSLLKPEQKEDIKQAARSCARHDDGLAAAESRALYQLLTGERL